MNTEQEYYYFRNTTNSTIIINDLSRPASIAPNSVSRSFSSDEVRQSSDIRRFYQLGILMQEEAPNDVLPPPLRRSIPASVEPAQDLTKLMPRARIPAGVDVHALDDKGTTYIASQGTEFVNPKFMVGDFVYVKGPTNLSGKITGRRGVDGRWIVALPDGRTAYAYEDGLMTVDQFAVSSPAEPQKKTLNASEVLKRGIVPVNQQRDFEKRSSTRIHADDVLRNRTAVPASQIQGRPLPKEVEAPVSGGRFNVDEVKGRPVHSGTEIVMADGRVVNSESLVNERLNPVQTSEAPVEEDRGTIIIAGTKEDPISGDEVTTDRLITDTIDNATSELSKAEKKRIANKKYQEKIKAAKQSKSKAPAAPAQVNKNAPAHVVKFLEMAPNQQKLFVVKENDVEKLAELSGFVPSGSVIKKLIDERVAQLQIA